ncbi:hypothetical protein HanRHA438_Chr08g0360561 [Helianthus annuus]|nr:hypothetical protein HanRHA438_Chr08g0360561 [Helianthus annuus]
MGFGCFSKKKLPTSFSLGGLYPKLWVIFKKKKMNYMVVLHTRLQHLSSHFYVFCVKQRKIESAVRGRKGDSEKRERETCLRRPVSDILDACNISAVLLQLYLLR